MIKRMFIAGLSLLVSTVVLAFDLDSLTTQLQIPQTIHGTFKQSRLLKNYAEPIISEGKFVILTNQALLWQVETPFPVTIRITDQGVEQLNQHNEWISSQQSAGSQSDQLRLFLGLIGGQVDVLEQQFTITLSGNSENWQMLLAPNSVVLEQIFKQIHISGDQVVRQIVMAETQGDQTQLLFDSIQLNNELTPFEQASLLP